MYRTGPYCQRRVLCCAVLCCAVLCCAVHSLGGSAVLSVGPVELTQFVHEGA